MIYYENEIKKSIKKGLLPKKIFIRFNNAFIALDATKDLGLFDIKRLKTSHDRIYYRLRKGKYRAIFYLENDDFIVISIAKREEVYNKWE